MPGPPSSSSPSSGPTPTGTDAGGAPAAEPPCPLPPLPSPAPPIHSSRPSSQQEDAHVEREADGSVSVYLFRDGPPPRDLSCPVCWELFRDPVVTRGGHSFCRRCAMRAIAQSGRCPITRTPLSLQQLAPNLLARSMVDDLRVHCTHGCVLGKGGVYELAPRGCPEVIAFGLRKAHRKACKYAPAAVGQRGRAGGPEREAAWRRARRKAMDRIELTTYAVIWSLVVFGALSTQYFGLLLRRAAWILVPLTGLPAVALAAYVVVERVLARKAGDDDDLDSDMEEGEGEGEGDEKDGVGRSRRAGGVGRHLHGPRG